MVHCTTALSGNGRERNFVLLLKHFDLLSVHPAAGDTFTPPKVDMEDHCPLVYGMNFRCSSLLRYSPFRTVGSDLKSISKIRPRILLHRKLRPAVTEPTQIQFGDILQPTLCRQGSSVGSICRLPLWKPPVGPSRKPVMPII